MSKQFSLVMYIQQDSFTWSKFPAVNSSNKKFIGIMAFSITFICSRIVFCYLEVSSSQTARASALDVWVVSLPWFPRPIHWPTCKYQIVGIILSCLQYSPLENSFSRPMCCSAILCYQCSSIQLNNYSMH